MLAVVDLDLVGDCAAVAGAFVLGHLDDDGWVWETMTLMRFGCVDDEDVEESMNLVVGSDVVVMGVDGGWEG